MRREGEKRGFWDNLLDGILAFEIGDLIGDIVSGIFDLF